jgi:hypothetical protein
VDIDTDGTLTPAERQQVDQWVDEHDLWQILSVTVTARIVAVHGAAPAPNNAGVTCAEPRSQGLIAALDKALATVRQVQG